MSILLPLEAVSVPLQPDAGTYRVGGTRVSLDSVIYAFRVGATAEEIVSSYPTLDLGDVYAVIAFYLHNQDLVDEYLREREKLATELQREWEKQFPSAGLRQRLLERRNRRLDRC